jgi:hypothetical protein
MAKPAGEPESSLESVPAMASNHNNQSWLICIRYTHRTRDTSASRAFGDTQVPRHVSA